MNSKACEKCGKEFQANVLGKGSPQRFCSADCRNRAAQERFLERVRNGVEVPTEKHCPRCEQTKPASEFWSSKRRADGLSDYCKQCRYEKRELARGNEPVTNATGAKVCDTCGTSKPYSAFDRHRGTPDRLTKNCRECIAKYRSGELTRDSRWQATRDAQRAQYAKDPKYRQQVRTRARHHHLANAERKRELSARWYEEHRDDQLAKRRVQYRERVTKLQAEKSRRGCKLCGEFHPACLDWHHRDPSQKIFNISELNSDKYWTEEEIEAELGKCEVLCRNCHAKLHWEEKHGAGALAQANLPL